jgi:hypothetical protein
MHSEGKKRKKIFLVIKFRQCSLTGLINPKLLNLELKIYILMKIEKKLNLGVALG